MTDFSYSKKESQRFGMKIHRASPEKLDKKLTKKYILENDVDVLILRIPSLSKSSHREIEDIGFNYLHADTLVYYSCTLGKLEVQSMRNELDFEVITQENSSDLAEMIPVIFEGYQNHYFSNKYLDKSKILDGYTEWAENYIAATENNKISWYVKKDGEIIGFATCSFDDTKNTCEGVLYGVMPSHSGKGVYSDIIRFTQAYFKQNGFSKMLVSTQILNYSVQKVWIREGFFLSDSYETYHINSLLDFSVKEIEKKEFSISNSEIQSFADFSGDFNKIHFDNEYAIDSGFEGRIAHGMIVQSFISKFFGTEIPGEGTIFLTNSNIFKAPIYPNQSYYFEFSILSLNKKNGLMEILVKVRDKKTNSLCLLSYNKLINKNYA